jgi:hypothetical protein
LTARNEIGRQPLQLLRLHLDYCTLTYGEGDCEAELGVTGSHKCFNTRATCQDVSAYTDPVTGGPRSVKAYTFITPVSGVPADNNFIPSLRSVSFSPVKIDPGKSLGRRGQVSAQLQDHPYHDILIDKYVADRDYEPLERGTFWTKLKQRNPYYNGRRLDVYSGYLSQIDDITQMDKRSYVIDQIDGPDGSGNVTITGRDVLRLADDKKALCPRTTLARLDDVINKADLAPINVDVVPAGAGNNFTIGDYVRINKEIFVITNVVADALTMSREQFNTEAGDHKLDDTVQLCVYYNNIPVYEIMYDLLTNYANIDSSYIDYDEWLEEAGSWLTDYSFTCLITDPTGVTKLINELIEVSACYIYYNEIEQKIKLVAVKPPEVAPRLLTDDNSIIEGSISIAEKADDRVTQINLYYNIFNYVEKLKEPSNYSNIEVRLDGDAESPVQYGDTRSRTIYSRWVSGGSFFGVEALMRRMLAAYRNVPLEIKFKIDAKDIEDIWTGSLFTLRHRNIVDDTGEIRDIIMRVIEISEASTGTWYNVRAIDVEREFVGRYCYIQEEDQLEYNLIDPDDRDFKGGWLCDDATELMPNGDDPYLMP